MTDAIPAMIYLDLNDILTELNADMEAAEAHGIATGMLSLEAQADAANWLRALALENELDADDEDDLLSIFDEIRTSLIGDNDDFRFDLLLPDDEEDLVIQAEALRAWCAGFLYGVGYTRPTADWQGEIGEVMRDMIEFTKMDCAIESEEDEQALTEIREYVRAAVFLVREHLLEAANAQRH